MKRISGGNKKKTKGINADVLAERIMKRIAKKK